MSATVAAGTAVAAVSPLRDPSRKRRGWTGGKALVSTSYSGAKEKVHKPKPDEHEATGAGEDA